MVSSAILRMTGLEPARAQCPLEPESSASASSATSAQLSALDYNTASGEKCQAFFDKIFSFFQIFLSSPKIQLLFKNKKDHCTPQWSFPQLLRMTGLEPARAQCPLEPESSASASSATSAHLSALDYNTAPKHFCQHIFYIFFIFLFYRNSGTKIGTRSVHTMPFTKASTAIVPFVFLLIMPKVVSIEVAPAGAMAQ